MDNSCFAAPVGEELVCYLGVLPWPRGRGDGPACHGLGDLRVHPWAHTDIALVGEDHENWIPWRALHFSDIHRQISGRAEHKCFLPIYQIHHFYINLEKEIYVEIQPWPAIHSYLWGRAQVDTPKSQAIISVTLGYLPLNRFCLYSLFPVLH